MPPGTAAKLVATIALLTLAVAPAIATPAAPVPVLPEDLRWASPPNNPAAQAAWVVGAEGTVGPYLLRVKLAAGGKLPPHTHPDTRSSTVLTGTLYVGFGTTFDAARMVAVPIGGVYVAPAGVPHFVWAKDGDVSYQEAGVGPTTTTPITEKE